MATKPDTQTIVFPNTAQCLRSILALELYYTHVEFMWYLILSLISNLFWNRRWMGAVIFDWLSMGSGHVISDFRIHRIYIIERNNMGDKWVNKFVRISIHNLE